MFDVSNEIKNYFKKHYRKNTNELEILLIKLKELGCSQMQTVFLLVNEANYSFRDANKIVLNSKAWNE